MILDRYDMFPHIENCMTMTIREWMYFHNVMHRHYTRWMDRKVLKPPFDWVVLGDIIQDTKPEVIIEIGSYEGGCALWMANLLDAMDSRAQVIGIDVIDTPTKVQHPRITSLIGDCLAPEILERVEHLSAGRKGMVIEDSDHKYVTTRRILEKYHKFVAKDCYFVVEDTIVEFMNVPPFPGPLRAVKEFVKAHEDSFVIDRSREKYILTYNPMGYLLKIKEPEVTHE
ncbi:MAG: hypothetical protein JRG73_10380 [Deltaproteobacteria bacterium]|nr:hypothetical protein [Deltaproteobacteria bacterium]MBW2307330.1 hypothetical protein [Deltaproteobacteria bacterium]